MPDRKPLISGNWKMNLNHFEATPPSTSCGTCSTKDDYEVVDVSVHPPFTDIRTVQTFIESEKVKIGIGAQNCHWEEKGAYTGEVAPGDARQAQRRLRHRGPQRAPRDLRRDRRSGSPAR